MTGSDVSEVMRLAISERWEEAKALVNRLIGERPGDEGLKVLQADIEILSGNEKEAMRQIKVVLRGNPEFAPAHYSAGILHARQGRWDQARSCFERAISLSADQSEMLSDSWLQLGIALWEQREPEDAIKAWQKSLAFNPAQWKAREYLEEFTSDFSRPKILGKPEFFEEFREIQVKKYLEERKALKFETLEEANDLFQRIVSAWNEIPEKWNFEDWAPIERQRYFRSIFLPSPGSD